MQDSHKQGQPVTGNKNRDEVPREDIAADSAPEMEPSRKGGKAQVGHITSCIIFWTLLTFTKAVTTATRRQGGKYVF